jgi:hypothetical protein
VAPRTASWIRDCLQSQGWPKHCHRLILALVEGVRTEVLSDSSGSRGFLLRGELKSAQSAPTKHRDFDGDGRMFGGRGGGRLPRRQGRAPRVEGVPLRRSSGGPAAPPPEEARNSAAELARWFDGRAGSGGSSRISAQAGRVPGLTGHPDGSRGPRQARRSAATCLGQCAGARRCRHVAIGDLIGRAKRPRLCAGFPAADGLG